MPHAVTADALRTPIGALGGSLSKIQPDDPAALALTKLAERGSSVAAGISSGRNDSAATAPGRPSGRSDGRLIITLLCEMRRRAPGQNRPFHGLVRLRAGAGKGEAMLPERLN